MTEKKLTFEQKLKRVQNLVHNMESGDIPLDESVHDFRQGISLINDLSGSLNNAKHTLAKVVNDSGKAVPFDRDKDGHDMNNSVD